MTIKLRAGCARMRAGGSAPGCRRDRRTRRRSLALGAVLYFFVAAYRGYYSRFGLAPEDVGITRAAILDRVGVNAVMLLALGVHYRGIGALVIRARVAPSGQLVEPSSRPGLSVLL